MERELLCGEESERRIPGLLVFANYSQRSCGVHSVFLETIRVTTQNIKLITVGIALAGTVLAVGDKITSLPLPGWLLNAWPVIYGSALIFDRIAHILWPDMASTVSTATVSVSTSGPAANTGTSVEKGPFSGGGFKP